MSPRASNVPHIEVDNTSTRDLCSQASFQNNLLSPYSLRSPSTPTAIESGNERSSLGRSSLNIPLPSPTLSTRSSVQSGQSERFAASKDLRNNDPIDGHSRRPSFASGTSGTTLADNHDASSRKHSDLGHETLRVDAHSPSVSSDYEKGRTTRGGISEADERTAYQRELDQEKKFNPYPFSFKPFQLAHLVNPPRDLAAMGHLGGTQALLKGLGTEGERGLNKKALADNSGALACQAAEDQGQRDIERAEKKRKGVWRWRKGSSQGASQRRDITQGSGEERREEPDAQILEPSPDVLDASVNERRRVYGPNLPSKRPTKSLLFLMWSALKDKVLVLLLIAAVIFLALALFQDLGAVDWVECVAIIVAIAIIVIVGSLNDWQKERQFKHLNYKKEERRVKVIRSGVECFIDSKEVVVGDIALLEPGEVVPCDGVFISGQHVRCNEAGVTGESDVTQKLSYEECMEFIRRDGHLPARTDCFIVSGSKVLEGVGRYVVIAVGTKSFQGRIMTALRSDPETTPSQIKLNALAELIAKLGFFTGLIFFSALMIRFFVQLGQNNPMRTASEKGIAFVNILIISVTLVVVAVPEGLPLAVTLALAFTTRRMTYENLLVRSLSAFESMENVSVVCTTMTGTLTENKMEVVAASIGVHGKSGNSYICQNSTQHNVRDDEQSSGTGSDIALPDIDPDQPVFALPPALRKLLIEAIKVNSEALVNPETEELMCIGNQTEAALLKLAKHLRDREFEETRDRVLRVQMVPFSRETKGMCVVVRLPGGGYRAYFKGASEILLKRSTNYVVVPLTSGRGPKDHKVETRPIGPYEERKFSDTIICYSEKILRCIAICYKDLDEWPSRVEYLRLAQDLTLIAIIAIQDELRPGVKEMVKRCHDLGVTVKMVTGNNLHTACSLARRCGVLNRGCFMEGMSFRKRTEQEQLDIALNLQVLARASPEDKSVLVHTLKNFEQIATVTADESMVTAADIRLSMGITGTRVAQEASDITVMDDNLTSIVKVILWSRSFNNAVRKLLQFQLSTIVTVVATTFVSAVASIKASSVLSAVQLLWIHLIMDPFAALALLIDRPSDTLLDQRPYKKTRPLLTTDMYKQILIQSIYQIAFTLIFHFLGPRISGLSLSGNTQDTDLIVKTLVFNAFVFAQISNCINCRQLDRTLNIFEGILRNRWFLAITLIEIGVQTLVIFIGGDAFQVRRIAGREWGISLALGFAPIPLGVLIRFMPNEPFERVFKKLGLLDKSEALPTVSPGYDARNAGIINKPELKFFTMIHGGRTGHLSL